MYTKNLMIIDPSLEIPELESYNKLASKSPIQTSYHLPAIHNSKSMENQIRNVSGVILMGSAASVHDNFDWMKNVTIVITKAIEKKVPILGICFGHQFLAHIFGGKIKLLWNTKKKIGIRKVKLNNNNLLKSTFEDYLIYSHQEGIVECPTDFTISGSSSMVEIEAISHKHLPIWSFQTHIEASNVFAERIGINQNDFKKAQPLGDALLNAFFNKIID